MANVPSQVLSEAFQQRLAGRRVLGALFLTYEFDPGFFELQVLPVILDTPVSHADVARLLQLEGDLQHVPHGVTVFYDWRGLRPGSAAPRLDTQRLPLRLGTGIFHPKNVFVLTEDRDPDEDGDRRRRLLVATMSANLTRSGWWENVETCHIEELEEGEETRLKDPLLELLRQVERLSTSDGAARDALEPYRKFLRTLVQGGFKSKGGDLYPHFYLGGTGDAGSVAEFLKAHIPRDSGYRLEVISPFFDKAPAASPLSELVKALQPDAVRVFLPRDESGAALCSPEMFDHVSVLGADWGTLPDDLLAMGRGAEASRRSVHAKVYRIFKPHPKTEYLFVGSPNLTAPGHSGAGGNLETGVLVQIEPRARPEFWLRSESRRPQTFVAQESEDSATTDAALPVQVRYSWKDESAFGRWDGKEAPPELALRGSSGPLVEGVRWRPRTWEDLGADVAKRLGEELLSSSIISVRTLDGRESFVLVQEEEMPLKPDLIRSLPVRDILEYWSLLKPEQRQAFLERRASLLAPGELGDLMVRMDHGEKLDDDMFERCAGIFHAFSSLENRVVTALEEGRPHQAAALVFGERFDSLGRLLDRVLEEPDTAGPGAEQMSEVDRYLVLMCGQQLCDQVRLKTPDFWASYGPQVASLAARLGGRSVLRARLASAGPDQMPEFLDWFDKWFLRRVQAEVTA